jgi:hypothetical protein
MCLPDQASQEKTIHKKERRLQLRDIFDKEVGNIFIKESLFS